MKFNNYIQKDKYYFNFCFNKIETITYIDNNIIMFLDFDFDLRLKNLNYEI